MTIRQLPSGDGYEKQNGQFVEAPSVAFFNGQALAAGVTHSDIFELGGRRMLALVEQVTAKAGTAPTLDITIVSSPDGVNDWQAATPGFAQKTDAAAAGSFVPTAVTSAGTTPPVVTLTGTQKVPVNLQVRCTGNAGARGTWTGDFSIDGGVTRTAFTSGATVPVQVTDPASGATIDTGLVLNIATGNAAVDNVWTATTANYERRRFTGLAPFVKAIASVGGSASPTMTASLSGRAH